MKSHFILFLSLFFCTGIFAQPTGYLWPTDASPYLSSTFAETRSAHFHAGLDIKTWGREGYKVFASKSGRIVRMGITSQGYGRVLYMQHEDETYTVYAHLQRFIPKLQTYIDSVRLINHQFEIDLNVRSENWYFEQGEVIGYTGSTGIGPPHLHFEIRDKNQRPINALLTDLEIIDTIPPKVSAILVIPMSDTTKIEGSKFPRIYYPSEGSDGRFEIGTINASGPIAMAINEYDQAEDVTNRYKSYEFRLVSETGQHFSSKHDSFDFEEEKTMFIDRIPAFGAFRRSFQTLYQEENISIPFHEENIDNGILIPTIDSTAYSIEVNDIYGNETIVSFNLLKGEFSTKINATPGTDVHQWYWRNNWLTKQSQATFNLQSDSFGQNWNSEENQRLATFGESRMLFSRIKPENFRTIISPDYSLKVHFLESSFFSDASIAVFTAKKDSIPSFSIMPHSTPIKRGFYFEYYLEESINIDLNYQIFHYDPFRDKHTHIPSELVGRTLYASSEVLGEFVLFPDNEAPEINYLEIITSDYGKEYVEIGIIDEFSGIDFERSEIMVNGVRGITEYDFEEDKLIYVHPDFKSESRNRIEVIVTDNAGNSRFEVFYR